jgi:tripartite-type tricarboxylate transporter receptor subunit TctC
MISIGVGLLALTGRVAAAEDFYKGKTITVIVGSAAGGGYDLHGRLVGRHIGRHIPGQPTLVAQNMPGAGSIVATNYIYEKAAHDGTAMGISSPSIALLDALGSKGVRFDSTKLNWIGRVASIVNVTFTRRDSKVKSLEGAQKTETLIGGISASSPLSLYPKVMNAVTGTKFKLITGYAGSKATVLATERGEVDGTTASLSTLAGAPDWRRTSGYNILVQYTMNRHRDIPDVPSAMEFAKTDDDRKIIGLYVNGADVGYSIMTTPGVPADRIGQLRRSFDAMLADTMFLSDVKKLGVAFDPLSGEKLQVLIQQTLDLSPEVKARARAASQ